MKYEVVIASRLNVIECILIGAIALSLLTACMTHICPCDVPEAAF